VWAIDFMFDETSDRRRLKLCNIVDEYTREALAIRSTGPAPPRTSSPSSRISSSPVAHPNISGPTTVPR
jgi:hypothetical protein